jgi:hypothetical protein
MILLTFDPSVEIGRADLLSKLERFSQTSVPDWIDTVISTIENEIGNVVKYEV